MKPDDFCEYTVELQKGQTLRFNRQSAKGLDILVVEARGQRPIGEAYPAPVTGRVTLRIRWEGWTPVKGEAHKARPFYARLGVE